MMKEEEQGAPVCFCTSCDYDWIPSDEPPKFCPRCGMETVEVVAE